MIWQMPSVTLCFPLCFSVVKLNLTTEVHRERAQRDTEYDFYVCLAFDGQHLADILK